MQKKWSSQNMPELCTVHGQVYHTMYQVWSNLIWSSWITYVSMFLHTCDPMGGPQLLFGVRRASPNTTGRPTATEARCVVPSLICGPVHLQLSASNGNVLVQEARWWSLDTLAEIEYQMWIRSVQLIRISKGFQTWVPRIVWHIHEVIILYHISVWHAQ